MYSNPKTGTSTVEYNAKMSVGEDRAIIVNKPNMEDFDALSNEQILNFTFISGHRMTEERVERIREIDPDAEVITLFRNPAEQIVSAYNYDINYKYGRKIPFWFWYKFLIPRNPQASHFVRRFQGRWLSSLFLGKRHYDRILDEYRIFNRVVVTKNINAEIPEIFESHGIKLNDGTLIKRKATGTDYVKYLSLDKKLRKKLERQNKLDFKLYRHFKMR